MSQSLPPQPPAGGPYPPAGAPGGPAQPLSDAETRQWAGLAHLGGILSFVPALIIWLVFRERSAFVDQEAKKALNFQIVATIAYVVAAVIGGIIPIVGWLIPLAVWIAMIVFAIQGYQAVNRGQAYTYPVNVELVK